MKIKHGHCSVCKKDVAAIGNFKTGTFLFTVFILLWLFAPLVWIPILTIGSYYNYHCPHCGRKIENL
jgi:hypothetical protein|nr:MAG TPA: LITAF-like protein [Caudoviricetes sp.]